jgi:putative ABC transport system permease protein
MWHEVVFAVRVCRRNAFATLAAVTSIALGIGATATVFSVANAILWRPLPYEDPSRLVVASAELRNRNTRNLPLSGPDFLDLRAQARTTFNDVAAVLTGRTLIDQADGTLAQVRLATVSPNFFRVLGRPMAIGRDFVDADGEPVSSAEGGSNLPFVQRVSTVAILSHEYWLTRYGGRSDVLGQRVSTSGGAGALIVGVLAPRG